VAGSRQISDNGGWRLDEDERLPSVPSCRHGYSVTGPLEGEIVLDLTRILSGPYATLLLADLGAEIWKVEEHVEGDETRKIQPSQAGESHYFAGFNRNKKSIALNLKHEAGRQLALQLAQKADVLVENFRPGVTERLGIDWSTVQQVNPRIIYCSISAFGQTGPERTRTAFDVAVQAMGGLMSITGEVGGAPVRAGVPVADLVAGLLCDVGVLAALVERDRTGRGQYVDVSMLDGMISMLSYVADRYLMNAEEPTPVGSGHSSVVPYGAYEAGDGSIVIATVSEAYWPRLCAVLNLGEAAADPRFASNATRVEHRQEVDGLISGRLRTNTVAHWDHLLREADIPSAPILKVSQALNHPQVRVRGMVRKFNHPRRGPVEVLGSPLHFSASENPKPAAAPMLGEHTAEILQEILGLSGEELAQYVKENVIRVLHDSDAPLDSGVDSAGGLEE
jgi:crotonobetainyl-CoA:carnitine CoA-transferase CaiB-like acyl-CoA transferase